MESTVWHTQVSINATLPCGSLVISWLFYVVLTHILVYFSLFLSPLFMVYVSFIAIIYFDILLWMDFWISFYRAGEFLLCKTILLNAFTTKPMHAHTNKHTHTYSTYALRILCYYTAYNLHHVQHLNKTHSKHASTMRALPQKMCARMFVCEEIMRWVHDHFP